MIEISTYVFTSPDYELVDALSKPPPDADYVKGVIELTIDGVKILTRREWDLVDQLWAYMVNGAAEVAAGRSFFTRFPDQPLELRFELVEADEVSIELRYPQLTRSARARVPRRDWIRAVATEATKALLAIGALIPEGPEAYRQELDLAAELLRTTA